MQDYLQNLSLQTSDKIIKPLIKKKSAVFIIVFSNKKARIKSFFSELYKNAFFSMV